MRLLNVAMAVLAFSLCVLGGATSAHATACAVNPPANYHPPGPPRPPVHTVPPYVTLPKPPPVPHGKHDKLYPPPPTPPSLGGPQVNLPPYGCFQAPGLNNALVIQNKCPEDMGGELSTGGRDVILELPRNRVCGGSLNVHNTGNVIIRGGVIRLKNEVNSAISIHEVPAGKTVFIEGVEIDGNNKNSDLIRTYRANNLNVFVQNSYLHGQRWDAHHHADCFHAQGGGALGNLVFQNVTCLDTGNNGFQVTYRAGWGGVGTKRLVIDHVDMSTAGGGHGALINFAGTGSAASKAAGDSAPPNGTAFRDFYVKNGPALVYSRPNWKTGGGGDCGHYGTWGGNIQGQVCDGLPGGNGHFATPSTTGLNYNRSRFCEK